MGTPDRAATFAFVDLAGFTAVTEVHGDREAVAILNAFRKRVREVLEPDDELVKTIGDAVMLRFADATRAVTALRTLLQREIATDEAVLLPRAGAHHGRAVAVDGDYYGAAVNLASRVAGLAQPGQLLVTGVVADAARQLGAVITHVGTPPLRNVSEPVDVWEVHVDAGTGDTAVDPVCHMRVATADANAIALDWHGRRHQFCGLPCVARFAASPTTYLARHRGSEVPRPMPAVAASTDGDVVQPSQIHPVERRSDRGVTRRALATIAAAAIALAGVVAWSGGGDRSGPDERPIHDGTYVGYVRTVTGRTDTLAVDLPDDNRAESVVYAGGLARLDVVGPTPRPFRITIESEAIVGLVTADDALPATARAASERSDPEARRHVRLAALARAVGGNGAARTSTPRNDEEA
jgi:class 3 adenylate cyclase/YHS domain-containing protein